MRTYATRQVPQQVCIRSAVSGLLLKGKADTSRYFVNYLSEYDGKFYEQVVDIDSELKQFEGRRVKITIEEIDEVNSQA